jgi:hypothetical protein
MDISDLKGHTLRVFNALKESIANLPAGVTLSDLMNATITMAGYSWKSKKFAIWALHLDNHEEFQFKTVRQIAITGDYVREAKLRLAAKLNPKGRSGLGPLDMQPFEVLCDMIKSGQYERIGGAPQLFKIYQSMTSRPYAVFWPSRASGKVTLLGRPLLDYEKMESLIVDPDSLEIVDPLKVDGKPGGDSADRREARARKRGERLKSGRPVR